MADPVPTTTPAAPAPAAPPAAAPAPAPAAAAPPAAPPAPAIPGEVLAELSSLRSAKGEFESYKTEQEKRWNALAGVIDPSRQSNPEEVQTQAKASMTRAEVALRTSHVANLAMGLNAVDGFQLANAMGDRPEFAVDMRTGQLKDPAAAQKAIEAHMATSPFWRRSAPTAAPAGAPVTTSAPPGFVPQQTQTAPVPGPSNPPGGSSTVTPTTKADLWRMPIDQLRGRINAPR